MSALERIYLLIVDPDGSSHEVPLQAGEMNIGRDPGNHIALVGRGPDSVVKTIASLSRSASFKTVELKTETRPEAKEGVPEGHTFILSTVYQPEVAP